MKDILTQDRTQTLGRLRRKLAFLRRNRPFYKVMISDSEIMVDALERLITLDLTKGN